MRARRARWVALGFLLFFSAIPSGAESATAGPATARLPIVDRAIAFHGGDLYRASETELDVCSRSGCFHVRARIDGDLAEYDVRGTVRGRERRVHWQGSELTVWQGEVKTAVEPGAEQRYKDWVMARVYFPFLPYRLNDPSVYREDLGLEAWNGRTLHKVKITFEPGSSTDASDEYLYWFDPESGRVEQFAYSYEVNGGGLRFRRVKNHRRVGGILFFDQENLGAEGPGLDVDDITPRHVEEKLRPISEVTLKNIEVRPIGD